MRESENGTQIAYSRCGDHDSGNRRIVCNPAFACLGELKWTQKNYAPHATAPAKARLMAIHAAFALVQERPETTKLKRIEKQKLLTTGTMREF
jgi:hypothetical protein